MAQLEDKGAQAPNQDTAKKMKRALRLEARLERIDYLLERGGDKAALKKEAERRKAELHYLKTTLEARLEA